MSELWFDLRHAIRRLVARPGYTAIMLVTLALAIGATTAVFTVVDETLLRRPPFAYADRLVDVLDTNRATGGGGSSLTPEKIAGWQQSPLFERFEGYSPRQFDIVGDGEPERVSGLIVTTGLFPMLGVQPTLGRRFASDEGGPGSPRVVIIDAGLWKRRFGGGADVLGRTLTLSDKRYTIIGVMPRRFHLLGSMTRADVLWIPVDVAHSGSKADPAFYGLGRLARGVAMASVQDRANVLADEYQLARPLERTWGLSIQPKGVSFVGASTRTVLFVLLGSVAFVLLIACANVANLFLSRAAAREREVAIRSALGASRGRLIREVLVESVILALVGGILGLLIAGSGVSIAMAMAPPNLSSRSTTTIEIDARILAVAFSLTMTAGILVGLVPALRGSSPRLEQTLRASSQTLSARRSSSMSAALVVVEMALALVLLVGAALMMRTFSNLHAIDPGFEMRGLVSMRVNLPPARYSSDAAQFAFANEVAQRLAVLPGVSQLTVASEVPAPGVGLFSVGLEGENGTADSNERIAQNAVSPEYFRTLRIPVRVGRTFSAADQDDAVVVSQSVADHFWPGGSAVGRRLRYGPTQHWMTVIGVVGSVEMWMGDTRLSNQVYSVLNRPAASVSTARVPAALYRSFTVTMRTSQVKSTALAVKAQVWAVDKSLPIESPTIIEEQWITVFGRQRFALQLMGAFAVIALILAAAGIFAVLSQLVSQRTREIGVRVALGASPRDVFQLIVSRGMILTLGGVAIGLAGAAAMSRLMTSLLFNVTPYDPASFAAVTVVLVGVALMACWLPTRRAMKVEPAVALRVE
jgi:putative ABC transport system permease protein